MSVRDKQRKQRKKISAKLIQAALDLSFKEGWASLSLRSVAREAGIAPTSFYRHFRDMDELGLAIVDQAIEKLEDSLDKILDSMTIPAPKKAGSGPDMFRSLDSAARPVVEAIFTQFDENPHLMHLFFQEHTGSSRRLRKAINRQLSRTSSFLARQLDILGRGAGMDFSAPGLAAESVLSLASMGAMERATQQDKDHDETLEATVLKACMALLGSCLGPE